MSVPYTTFTELLIDAQGTLTADLTGATMHLFTAAINAPSMRSLLTDFTEAAWTGYAAKTLAAPSTGYRDVNGVPAVKIPTQSWTGPAAGNGPLVLGAYIVGANAAYLISSALFDQPVSMADQYQQLTVDYAINAQGVGWVITNSSAVP